MLQRGLTWYALQELYADKLRSPLTIAFAFVATHNHFVLDRGGKVFNRSAPIIKLKDGATEEDHLALLAYSNSSTACFYARQVLHSKGAQGVNEGHKAEEWEQFLEFSGTQIGKLPRSERDSQPGSARPGDAGPCFLPWIESPAALVERARLNGPSLEAVVEEAAQKDWKILGKMIAVQERIDFEVYRLFGIDAATHGARPSEIEPGSRPFEVQLARNNSSTAWFERHGYQQPASSAPGLDELHLSPEVRLLEQPTFKRRWLLRDLRSDVEAARRQALVGFCEAWLAERATPEVAQGRLVARYVVRGVWGAETITPNEGGELTVTTWISDEAVPFLAAHRHTPAGLEKRFAWERVWDLQRAEDRGEQVPPFDPPPKYDIKDYRDPTTWRLRGKLDVPKERFISYPGCESDEDHEPVYGWAGWNHEQQAQPSPRSTKSARPTKPGRRAASPRCSPASSSSSPG